MRLRLALTLDFTRDRAPERDDDHEAAEHPPQVDHKGAFLIERSNQPEGDEMRGGPYECRIGFQPNPEGRP